MPSDFRPSEGTPDRESESLDLVALPIAVREARVLVQTCLPKWALATLVDDCAVVVSEFVTNSVRHAQSLAFIGVRLRLTEAYLVAEVFDASFTLPSPRAAAEDDEDGRGLPLVDALSDHWGHHRTEDGKVCWAAWKLADRLPAEPSELP